jgi:hypothetical protein
MGIAPVFVTSRGKFLSRIFTAFDPNIHHIVVSKELHLGEILRLLNTEREREISVRGAVRYAIIREGDRAICRL